MKELENEVLNFDEVSAEIKVTCVECTSILEKLLCMLYVNTNLYSALGGTHSSYQLHFTIAAAKALCHTSMRGSHPLPTTS